MKYEHYDLLIEMVEKGYVSVQKHPTFDYYIYNYTQTTQFEKMWNEATIQARGLILNSNGEIISRPFKKFFNIQEHSNKEIPWHEEFTVSEKVDGSLGIAYLGEDDEVYIATRGSFTSDQAIWATNWLRENTNKFGQTPLDVLIRFQNWQCTYLFEIIYKNNRIVVDYGDFEGLIFLGGVENITGGIIQSQDSIISKETSMRAVEYFDVSDIKELLSHDKNNFEGYVVRFYPSGFTMKVKLDEYVRLHRILTNVSNVSIWEALKNGDELEEILQNVPDEFYDWVSKIISGLQEKYDEILSVVGGVHNHIVYNMKDSTRKEIALYLLENHKNLSSILFSVLDGKDYSKMIWDMVRPQYQKPFYQKDRDDA
jgi:RNA ligase